MRTEGLQRVPLSLDMRGFNNFGGRMKALKALFVAALVGATSTMTAYAEKLTIATVNNSDMIIMQ